MKKRLWAIVCTIRGKHVKRSIREITEFYVKWTCDHCGTEIVVWK